MYLSIHDTQKIKHNEHRLHIEHFMDKLLNMLVVDQLKYMKEPLETRMQSVKDDMPLDPLIYELKVDSHKICCWLRACIF